MNEGHRSETSSRGKARGGGQTVRHCVCEPRAGAIYIHTALLLLLLLLEKLWHDARLVRAATEPKTKWVRRRAEQSCRLRQRKGLIIMLSSSSSSSSSSLECASRGVKKMRSFASTRSCIFHAWFVRNKVPIECL